MFSSVNRPQVVPPAVKVVIIKLLTKPNLRCKDPSLYLLVWRPRHWKEQLSLVLVKGSFSKWKLMGRFWLLFHCKVFTLQNKAPRSNFCEIEIELSYSTQKLTSLQHLLLVEQLLWKPENFRLTKLQERLIQRVTERCTYWELGHTLPHTQLHCYNSIYTQQWKGYHLRRLEDIALETGICNGLWDE